MYDKLNDLQRKLKNRMLNLYRLSLNSMISILLLFIFFNSGNTQSNPDDNWTAFGGTCGSNGLILTCKIDTSTGHIYVAGTFSIIGGIVANNIAKWDGTQWNSLGSGTNGQVRDMIFKDGELIVIGSFTQAGGISSGKVAKWNGNSWISMHLSNSSQTVIGSVEIYNDTLYLGMRMSSAYTTMYKRSGSIWLAVPNSPDYIVDLHVLNNNLYIARNGGVYVYDGNSFTNLVQNNVNIIGTISTITSKGDSIIVGGSLTWIDGVYVNKLALWNGTSWSALGSFNSSVNALHVFNNELYVAGGFNDPAYLPHLRKLNSNNVWQNVASTGNGITCMTSFNNELIMAGSFDQFNNFVVAGLIKFSNNTWSTICGPNTNGLNSWVYDQINYNDDLLLGGLFLGTRDITSRGLIKYDGNNLVQFGPELSGSVTCFFKDGNNLYLGGGFTKFDGVTCNNILKYDGNSWSTLGSGVNSVIYSITKFGNDIVAAGAFTTAGGASANRIAKWNGTSWSALGSGLNNTVNSICVYNNELYAAGKFNTAGGVSALRIAKWNGTTWSNLGTGLGNTVTTITQDVNTITSDNNFLYAGGSFPSAGGNTANRIISKWDGSSWSPLGAGLLSGEVKKLVIHNDTLYAGGNQFFSYNSNNLKGLGRYFNNSWQTFGSGVLLNSAVDNVLSIEFINNNLYCAGGVDQVGGKISSNFAKWTYPSTLLTYYQDNDNDGFGNTNITQAATSQPPGYKPTSGDCDDNDAQVYPNSPTVKTKSTSTSWSDAGHWSCNIPAANTDSIVIAHKTVFNIASATLGASLTITNDTLTIQSGSTLNLGSTSEDVIMRIANGGTIVVQSGALLKVYGKLETSPNSKVINHGTIQVIE